MKDCISPAKFHARVVDQLRFFLNNSTINHCVLTITQVSLLLIAGINLKMFILALVHLLRFNFSLVFVRSENRNYLKVQQILKVKS